LERGSGSARSCNPSAGLLQLFSFCFLLVPIFARFYALADRGVTGDCLGGFGRQHRSFILDAAATPQWRFLCLSLSSYLALCFIARSVGLLLGSSRGKRDIQVCCCLGIFNWLLGIWACAGAQDGGLGLAHQGKWKFNSIYGSLRVHAVCGSTAT